MARECILRRVALSLTICSVSESGSVTASSDDEENMVVAGLDGQVSSFMRQYYSFTPDIDSGGHYDRDSRNRGRGRGPGVRPLGQRIRS